MTGINFMLRWVGLPILALSLCLGLEASATADTRSVMTGDTQPLTCDRSSPYSLQILGSGGPLNAGGRASTAYLLWLRGKPSIMVDMGPGSIVNLAKAGANPNDVDALLISHIHPDHVSDLAGLLWDMDVLERKRPLTLVGPAGNASFPDIATFISRQFGAQGAYPFMQYLLDRGSSFHLDIRTLAATVPASPEIMRLDGTDVLAYPVSHGKAPTLAYRINGDGFSVVFAGDQNGLDRGFAKFAMDADVLVLHTALGPQAYDHPFAKGIGLPKDLGALAAEAKAKTLILSHLMGMPANGPTAADFSLSDPTALVESIRAVYGGKVILAQDMECIALPGI